MTCLVPLCYYPMKKIIVDDNRTFAESILFKMHGKNFDYYESPVEALQFLNNYQPALSKPDLLLQNNELANSATACNLNLDISKLKQHSLCAQDISVLFVDYCMPEMTGLELLRRLKDLPIKKILMTAMSDDKYAIDAFNQGLIDGYIRKGDPEIFTQVQNTCEEMENKYFTDLCQFISGMDQFYYLENIHFANFFQDYIQEHRIKSWHLDHINGNYILRDNYDNIHHLLIRTRSQLKTLAKLAAEDGAADIVIKQLDQGNAIPFFDKAEDWEIPGNQWEAYLHPAQWINGENEILWSVPVKKLIKAA